MKMNERTLYSVKNASLMVLVSIALSSSAIATEPKLEPGLSATDPSRPAASPLLIEEQNLLHSSDAVKLEVVKNTFTKFNLTDVEFFKLPPDKIDDITSEAYYTLAIERAFLEHNGNERLVAIINSLNDKSDIKKLCFEFEATYFSIYKTYPDLVPVDSEGIRRRLLNDMRIR
jgi:hypothetical protein